MADLTEAQLAAAEARGEQLLAHQPRAATAHYNRSTGHIEIDLTNGCTFRFPAEMVQDLQGAGPDDLSGVLVDGAGVNLHWPALDADLYVPALPTGIFGTRAWMTRALARAEVT